jgi:hypothetical protein
MRTRRTARGRAILMWAVGVFAGVQILTSLLVDYRWFRLRYPMYQEQISRFDQTVPAPNVIFLGSSRSSCLVNEGEMNRIVRDLTGDGSVRCFNAALGYGDPVVCERVLRDLLERGARPRFVVVECSPEGVNQRNAWLSGYVAWLLCWHDFPEYGRELLVSGNMLRFAGGHLLPTYVYRDPLRRKLCAVAKDWVDGPAASATASAAPPASRKMPASSAAKWQQAIADRLRDAQAEPPHDTTPPESYARALRNYQPGGNSAVRLERLLGQCRAHGIEPIIVSMPLSRAHREQYLPEVESAYHAYLAQVSRKYACRHVDYRERLPDTCFRDHHHATEAGGVVFSHMFALEVLAPLWSEQGR